MYKVIDVTTMCLQEDYPHNKFDSLSDAFQYCAEQIELGLADRFEIYPPNSNHDDGIEIDARDFCYA